MDRSRIQLGFTHTLRFFVRFARASITELIIINKVELAIQAASSYTSAMFISPRLPRQESEETLSVVVEMFL
jgi:hypothetical protein